MTHQEMVVVQEMLMATEVEDLTERQGVIMEHQEVKIILRIVVQIEIQNTEIRKKLNFPRKLRFTHTQLTEFIFHQS